MSEKDQLRNRVELIVRRELAQMNKDKAKSILVVLDGGMASIDDFLNQLASCRQEGCEVVIVASLLAAENYALDSLKSSGLNVWTGFPVKEGVIITKIEANGPADKSGLKEMDIIWNKAKKQFP